MCSRTLWCGYFWPLCESGFGLETVGKVPNDFVVARNSAPHLFPDHIKAIFFLDARPTGRTRQGLPSSTYKHPHHSYINTYTHFDFGLPSWLSIIAMRPKFWMRTHKHTHEGQSRNGQTLGHNCLDYGGGLGPRRPESFSRTRPYTSSPVGVVYEQKPPKILASVFHILSTPWSGEVCNTRAWLTAYVKCSFLCIQSPRGG